MDVKIKVTNQEMRVATNLRCLAEGSQQFIRFVFRLDEEWDDLLTFAQFVQGSNAYNVYLAEDYSCYLPSEIQPGKCYLMLRGTREGVIATTHFLTLTISKSKYVADAESTEITESLYDQLVDIVMATKYAPYSVSTVSEMTDIKRVYIYTGEEVGYEFGHWYYWDGNEWSDGGTYVPAVPDTELDTTSTNAVQNKVIAQAIEQIDSDVSDIQDRVDNAEDVISALEETKANQSGEYDELISGFTKNIYTDKGEEEYEPYFRRKFVCDKDTESSIEQIIGGSLCVNQCVDVGTTTVSIPPNRLVYTKIDGVESIFVSDGSAITVVDDTSDKIIDLTIYFGGVVDTYLIVLEQESPGSGIEWVKKYIPDNLPYTKSTAVCNSSTSGHKIVGLNQWDEEWEKGRIGTITGEDVEGDGLRSKNMIPVLPSTAYTLACGSYPCSSAGLIDAALCYYDANGDFISGDIGMSSSYFPINTPSNARYFRFSINMVYPGSAYNNDICLYLSSSVVHYSYEPYNPSIYSFNKNIILRGFPAFYNDNLRYIGDVVYKNTIERHFLEVDLGDLDWTIETGHATNQFSTTVSSPGIKPNTNYILCTLYKTNRAHLRPLMDDKEVTSLNDGTLVISDSDYSTAAGFKTAMSGVKLVCEAAEVIVENLDVPYEHMQFINTVGTEEYITDGFVPVGHQTLYLENLKEKLENIEGVPSYRLADKDKFLAVNSTGNGLLWKSAGGSSDIPPITPEDEGNVLTVNQGEASWAQPQSGGSELKLYEYNGALFWDAEHQSLFDDIYPQGVQTHQSYYDADEDAEAIYNELSKYAVVTIYSNSGTRKSISKMFNISYINDSSAENVMLYYSVANRDAVENIFFVSYSSSNDVGNALVGSALVG